MKARKKFFTMFLSMLLVFTMMPLSAIPVTAADSTDPPPAALDQTKPVDETLTETDIQTETESTTTPEPPPASETQEPDPGVTATGRMTVSQPAMTAAAGDAHLKVIMDNGQTLYLYPGNTIKERHTGEYYTEAVTNRPSIYVACLKQTATYQWTLELNNFNGQSITYVPGNSKANSVVISLGGNNVLAPKDGGAVDANQNNYRAISCGNQFGDGRPKGLSFIIEGSGSLAIRANDRNTAYQMWAAQCIFTQGLTIRGDAKVSIDLKLPSYESDDDSHAIFTSNLYVFDNASLDIKSYNVGEVVKANAHDRGGSSFISIDTTGTVNVEFGCDELERTYPRVFCGYASSDSKNFAIENVGYMSIARKGYRTDNDKEPERFDFVATPGITVSEDVTVKTFTSDNIKRIQYFSVSDSSAVKVQLFDGRIKDGKFKAYDELWVPLNNVTADLTITAPESKVPFKKWVAMADDLTAENPGFDLPVNGLSVNTETIRLYFDSPGTYRILAKYDPFGGTPKWTKGYSPAANCTTGTVSWTAPDSLKDITGVLIPATFQLSGSSPVAAKDKSGNDIDKVKSGVSVFAKQSGSGITYALQDTGAKRIALNYNGRWHFSESFVPNLDDLELPPAPQLASLNCSGEKTPLSPSTDAAYPFIRGLIVEATNFDYDKYEMYYTFNRSGSGGSDPGDPVGTSPRANYGVIVLKEGDTWLGVTHLRVRFKSKATGAWSPTTWVPLQRISESEPDLYKVAFAPAENYTQSVGTLTITGPITATVTKVDPDQWPINAELVYSTHPIGMARFFEPYTGPVPIDDAGAFRVGVRVPDPKSSSDEYSVIRDQDFTIKLAQTYTKYTLTVVNGRAYQANGSEFSTNSTGSSRTYNINGNVLVEVRADPPTGGKVFEKWTGSNVGVADPYNPTTTLTMPTHNNARVTAELNGNPLITGETRLKMTPEDGPIGALKFFHKNYGSRRMLTYDWYDDINQKLGPDEDFESGRCYTAKVEVKPVPGARFDGPGKVSMGLNHASGTQDISFTRVNDQLLRTEIRLLFKPELTMALAPGDALPTKAALATQLPSGYIIDTLTWADNATTVPSGATEMTITELKISGANHNSHVAGGAIVIDGTAYPVSSSHFNTVTLTNVKVPVKPKGVKVSGTITSYGSDSESVTVQLIEAGLTEPAYEDIVTGNIANYFFDTVPAGTYTLKVIKKGHAPFTKEITIGDSNVTEDVTVYLIGDVDGNGKVEQKDSMILSRYFAGWSGYETKIVSSAAADVDQDGELKLKDSMILSRYFAGWSEYTKYFQ